MLKISSLNRYVKINIFKTCIKKYATLKKQFGLSNGDSYLSQLIINTTPRACCLCNKLGLSRY